MLRPLSQDDTIRLRPEGNEVRQVRRWKPDSGSALEVDMDKDEMSKVVTLMEVFEPG